MLRTRNCKDYRRYANLILITSSISLLFLIYPTFNEILFQLLKNFHWVVFASRRLILVDTNKVSSVTSLSSTEIGEIFIVLMVQFL